MPITEPDRTRFAAAIIWAKRVVFLLVLIGLIAAAKQSVDRWNRETVRLRGEITSLRTQAAAESDPSTHTSLLAEASRRESSVPSLANLGWSSLGCSAIFYAVGLLPPCWVLFRCVDALGVPCSLARASAAQLLGHAGKYIPGKAMVVVLRVGTISNGIAVGAGNGAIGSAKSGPPASGPPASDAAGSFAKGPTGLIASAVFYETLLMMGVGGLVAGGLLWSSDLPVWVRAMAAMMAIGAVVPVCPPVMRRLIKRLQNNNEDAVSLSRLNWPLLVESGLASLLSWALIGLSFTYLIDAIPSFESTAVESEWVRYTMATAAIALGMVLGFASLLPGGAGVREFVTLLILSPMIGPTHALLAVIAARLMFILVEAMLAGVSWVALRTR